MKYEIAEELSICDSFMSILGNEEATKKAIVSAMEYIDEHKCPFPSYTKLANVLLVSDEGKENTIAIQRHALKVNGYTGWGGLMGDGAFDGPSREVFILSMAQIQIHGWEKWVSTLITRAERKIRDEKNMAAAVLELKKAASKNPGQSPEKIISEVIAQQQAEKES